MKRCYLCKKNGLVLNFTKLGFEIDRCPNCNLRSLNFKGNYDKFLTTYYQKGFFTGGKRFRAYADYEGDKPVHILNLKGHLKGLLRVLKSSKLNFQSLPREKPGDSASKSLKLLDAGCAMGYFMELARDVNFDVYGVDVSDYAVDIAKKNFGDKVKLGQIENLDKLFNHNQKPVKFNIVTMFDLIEHLQNPREVLEKINNSMNDDGLLLVQTGNASSHWARLLGKNWHFFAPPQHFFFFTEENLKNLLRQTGFEVIKIDRDGKWVSLRYLFHMMRYVSKDGLGDLLYKLTHKNFLGRIPLLFAFGDNMIIYAKKTV